MTAPMTTRAGAGEASERMPALESLRLRTRRAHEDLDAALTAPAGRVSDLGGYVRLLSTLSALHAVTDEPLRAWVHRTPWVRGRLDPGLLPQRGALYAADLAALGRPDRAVAARTDRCDDARGLGHLYVVAGSSKGARVVLRHLPDDVAPEARRGLHDAAEAGTRLWRDCQAVLTIPLPAELVVRAADEAHALFRTLRRDATDPGARDRPEERVG